MGIDIFEAQIRGHCPNLSNDTIKLAAKLFMSLSSVPAGERLTAAAIKQLIAISAKEVDAAIPQRAEQPMTDQEVMALLEEYERCI